jgi:hypothetical protein
MMISMEPQHISRKAVRIVEAVCSNSGAGAEVQVSITTNESSGASWIDLRIEVAGDPPCQVVLTTESAAELARNIDHVRSAFLAT